MSFTDKKLELAIGGLAIVLIGALGYALKTPVQTAIAELEVRYEMPRPKNSFLAALFNLGDREISRNYVNPFATKKADAAKPTAETKSAEADAKKSAAKNKTVLKKKETAPKKNVDVQIVSDDATTTVLGDDNFMNSGSAPAQQIADAGRTSSENNGAVDRETLSGDQWRALLLAQPTKENIAKLVNAYNRKEVDDSTFYTIVADLFRSNKADTQGLALDAVKAVYNVKSFSVTAKYFDHLTPELQQQAHAYLLTYAVKARLTILASALQSADGDVVEAAAQVVIEGHQRAKGGVTLDLDPRYARGDIATNSLADYSKFIPLFQQLAQSQDATIAGLAHSALGQLQSAIAAL